MEVHHPHHPTHKKKWSEYLLEFFMLFFAVTLGFFAENIREHLSENNKKRELLEIVSRDFSKDLDQLNFHKNYAEKKLIACNNMIQFLDENPAKINQNEFYHSLYRIKGWWFFNPEEKSRIEAESKGNFYSDENSDLAFAILRFNFFKNDYKTAERHEERLIEQFINQIPHISKFEIFNGINHYPEKEIKSKYDATNFDKSEIKKTKYLISEIKFNNDVYLDDIDSMSFYAQKAIKIINNQH